MATFLRQEALEHVYDPEEMHQFVLEFAKMFKNLDLNSSAQNPPQYSEFDSKAIFAILRKYNPDEKKLQEDMFFLMPLILSNGTDMLHATLPFAPQIQERLHQIVVKYHIEKSLPIQSTKETITLRRILRAFPDIAFRVLKDNPNLPRLLSPKAFEDKYGYKYFPACIAGDFIFGLMPPGNLGNYDGIVKAALHYQFDEIRLMSKQHLPFDTEKVMQEIACYGYKLFLESRFSPQEKKQFIEELNIDQGNINDWAKCFNRLFFTMKNIGFYFGNRPAGW